MLIPASRSALLVSALASLLSGCASISINDLSLKSIRVVDAAEQAEFNYNSLALAIARMAGDPEIVKDERLANIGPSQVPRAHEWLIKAEFTSKTDLSTVKYSDNLGSEIFFCHRPDVHTLLSLPYVYSNGSIVPSGKDMPLANDGGANERPLFTYYVYFRVVRNDVKTPSIPPLVSFDLRKNPEDVCLRVVGGEYRAFGFHSNTIVVSQDTIAGALRDLPATQP